MGARYAELSDLAELSLPPRALERFTEAQRLAQLEAATDEANSFLGGKLRLPLVAWGPALRRHVGMMAASALLLQGGLDPEAKEYEVIRAGRKDAIDWLQQVASGLVTLQPPTYVDSSTPSAPSSLGQRGPYVVQARVGPDGATRVGRPRSRGWNY